MPKSRKRKADETSTGTINKIVPITTEPTEKLDATLPVLYIEHCRGCTVFRRRALELHEELLEGLRSIKSDLKLQLQLNADGKPRSGSFEISISQQPASADKRKLLWSGWKKTPRAKKWPNMEKLLQEVCENLKLTDAKNSDENEATNAAEEEEEKEVEEEPKPKISRTRKPK